jgi:CRP/FNR family transcriptional regulator
MIVMLRTEPRDEGWRRPVRDACLAGLFLGRPLEVLESGEALFFEQDPADHVFQLVDGVVSLSRALADGRRSVTGFRYPGDLLGTGFQDRCLCTAEAVLPVRHRRLARRLFQSAVADSPALGRELQGLMCAELAAAEDHMLLLGRKSAQERVASFLLAAARRLPCEAGRAGVPLAMTRQDIADHLGLTIETVSRTITLLRGSGAIVLAGAQRVFVRDPGRLAALAGETPDTGSARAARR